MFIFLLDLFLKMSSTLQDTQSSFLETVKEPHQMYSNVALSARTINLLQQSLDKEDNNGWIFYNGIPITGTSSLRQSITETGRFQIKDLYLWGCKSLVANNWTKLYKEDLLLEKAQLQNHSLKVFATGHACWMNFSWFEEQPIRIQTVRNPISRWRSSFNHAILGNGLKRVSSVQGSRL